MRLVLDDATAFDDATALDDATTRGNSAAVGTRNDFTEVPMQIDDYDWIYQFVYAAALKRQQIPRRPMFVINWRFLQSDLNEARREEKYQCNEEQCDEEQCDEKPMNVD